MKKILTGLFLFSACSSLGASAYAGIGPEKSEILKLADVLGNKVMVCKPQNKAKPDQMKSRGDEGFFKVKLDNGYLEIIDNGGMGFGFGEGSIRDLHVGNEDIFISVGDDGHQILLVEKAFDSDSNCAEARMISYFDGFHGSAEADSMSCCLK